MFLSARVRFLSQAPIPLRGHPLHILRTPRTLLGPRTHRTHRGPRTPRTLRFRVRTTIADPVPRTPAVSGQVRLVRVCLVMVMLV